MDKNFLSFVREDERKVSKVDYKLNFNTLMRYDPRLAESLLDRPEEVIQLIDIAIEDHFRDGKKRQVIITHLPKSEELRINSIRQKDLKRLVKIKGMIQTRTKVFPRIKSVRYECPSCGSIIRVVQFDELMKSPTKCGCGRKGSFRILEKEYQDTIIIKLEELPERLKGSEQAADIRGMITDSLCDEDHRLILGSRVEAVGYLGEVHNKHSREGKSVNCDYLFHVLSYDNLDEIEFETHVSPEEQELFNEIKSQHNPAKFIAKLIMKDIYGYSKVKESTIYQQFGGTMYAGKRDFIHILMFGHPGVAKTDIMMRAIKINPIHKMTTGPGMSGVGATATVKKDELTGNFSIVGGLLPRANCGTAAIDEIEKMHDSHKKAFHTPMEQGFCAIDKAGCSGKLLTNTAIVATCNPKVPSEPLKVSTNCDLPAAILDRFDIIFAMKDFPNRKTDKLIADKLLERAINEDNSLESTTYNCNQGTFSHNGNTFHIVTLKKYIYICKKLLPKLSLVTQKIVSRWYVELRESSMSSDWDQKKPTPRVVESILRMGRAIARSKQKTTVTVHELKLAISYFDFIFGNKESPSIIEEKVS